jgi:hypothetical protein
MTDDKVAGKGVEPEVEAPAVAAPTACESSFWRSYRQFMYGLSLPERALRSTTALVGGTLHEAGQLLIPQAFRSSRSYGVLIQQSLDFLLSEVGRVTANRTGPDAAAAAAQSSVARKAVGSFLDMAGVATLHVSPLTVLAIIGDVAYGSQAYLRELSDELARAGVIDERSTIHHAADLLEAVRKASHVTSGVFDAPPLSVDGMRETINQTTESLRDIDPARILPRAELDQLWNGIREIARQEGVSPFEVSSSLALYTVDKVGTVGRGALSSATVAGNLFDRHIIDHYRSGLRAIQQRGLYAMVSETYQPYVDALWNNFSSSRTTMTEEMLSGRLIGRAWGAVSQWWRRDAEARE